jgi:hypothetical protein
LYSPTFFFPINTDKVLIVHSNRYHIQNKYDSNLSQFQIQSNSILVHQIKDEKSKHMLLPQNILSWWTLFLFAGVGFYFIFFYLDFNFIYIVKSFVYYYLYLFKGSSLVRTYVWFCNKTEVAHFYRIFCPVTNKKILNKQTWILIPSNTSLHPKPIWGKSDYFEECIH